MKQMRRLLVWSAILALGVSLHAMQGGQLERVTLEVEGKGQIVIEMDRARAPKTVAHIADLVQSGFYNQQRFHKVVKSPRPYLVQIGDPASRTGDINSPTMGTTQPSTKIAYENTGLKHVRGAVGLSRLDGNRDSGDSQFYITLDSYPFLDGQYTVFGRVVKGMEVVDKITVGDRVTQASWSR